jgi:hypothetical protein
LGVEAAFQAVATLDNSTVDGITFNVELSKNLLKQFNSSQDLTAGMEHGSPSKVLSSPSRSAHDLRQQFPITPVRSVDPLERIPSLEVLSPYGSIQPESANTPLSRCSSMNTMKFSPSHQQQQQQQQYGHKQMSEATLPRTLSGRTLPPQPPHYQNPYPNMTVNAAAKNFSRENSFRSSGLRSSGGSFRTLNQKSTSQNSMSSSYGTTVSCTSTPSPFHNGNIIPVDGGPLFEKNQSFRSDPGANRMYVKSNNSFGQFEANSLLGQGPTHSLSFQDSPISRSLFSVQNSRFGRSDSSLVSGSSHHSLLAEHLGSFSNKVVPPRPDSRASDCSDDSTDNEDAVLVLNDNHPDDFFSSFLSKKIGTGEGNNSNKARAITASSFEATLLDLDSLTLNGISNL